MSSSAAATPTRLDALLRRGAEWRERAVAVRPAYVLGPLLAAQWLALLAFALTVRHNGWAYYQGGDQLYHYTSAWLLAHGTLPPAFVGYGWPVLLAPLAAVAGPNLVTALPFIVLFNTLVLLPVALLGIYAIGARIAGRLFGYLAAALWIVIPYAGALLVTEGYHQKYTEVTLPQVLGLTAMSDFPSVVALIVGAYLCLRALDGGGWLAAGASGFVTGYSIAIKPSGAIYLVAPVLALLVYRRRALLPFAVGLAPALLTLALWKYRAFGHVPAFSAPPPRRVALGADDLLSPVHRYTHNNSWTQLHNNLLGLREHFWVARVLEWLPLAGMVGLLARARRAFLLVGAWFVVFLLLKGTYTGAAMDDATFFRILMPAYPAYVLLVASVVLLVPGVRARAAQLTRIPWPGRRLALVVGVVFVLFAVAPLAVVAAVTPLRGHGERVLEIQPTLVPVVRDLELRATPTPDGVRLTWRPQKARAANVFYRVLRTGSPDLGISCETGYSAPPAYDCRLTSDVIAVTRGTTWTDPAPPARWTYRVGVTVNWLNDFQYGDVYVLSKPVTVVAP